MKKLADVFHVEYGNKFDMNKMTPFPRRRGGVSFVGRADSRQGVTGTVSPVADVTPYPSGLITVALGGRKALASFVQEYPFYTAQNVAVLTPKCEMTFPERVFACVSIRSNRFRYSTCGREANRTLRELSIPTPDGYPEWVNKVATEAASHTSRAKSSEPTPPLDPATWRPYTLTDLFDVRRGQGLAKNTRQPGPTPYIGALDRNNGLAGHVSQPPQHPANTITLNWNGVGGVGVAFYQPIPYWCSGDVNALYARFRLTPAVAIFLTTIIRLGRYRFKFGRKMTLGRLNRFIIHLPAAADGTPDWDFMERYVNALPYSSQL